METPGNLWIFSKTLFHMVGKTLLKTKKIQQTTGFFLLKASHLFSTVSIFFPWKTSLFHRNFFIHYWKNVLRCQQILAQGFHKGFFSPKFLHKFCFSTALLFHLFQKRKTVIFVSTNAENFPDFFRMAFSQPRKSKCSCLPLDFSGFPDFQQALKLLLLHFFFSCSYKSAKKGRLRFFTVWRT